MITFAVRIATAILLLCPMTLDAFSQSLARPSASGPVGPGSSRVAVRNPSPENWICKRAVCECKPLVCPIQSVVTYSIKPTKVRGTDPKALESFAKTEGPKIIVAAPRAPSVSPDDNDKFETITTKVSRHHGLPGVISESKFVKDKRPEYMAKVMIFSGPMLVSIASRSPDRALAMKSLNEFINAMTVEQGPS